jgi:lysylphosphatidylglycerol synthetase-like protein (DUF2156 family)
MYQQGNERVKVRHIYMVLCILGTALPLSQFVPWAIENGLNPPLLIQELFSTKIGAFFGLDVIVSAIALLVFIFTEGVRINMKKLWISAVATLCIGVSLGLPLFLYMRQIHIEAST